MTVMSQNSSVQNEEMQRKSFSLGRGFNTWPRIYGG